MSKIKDICKKPLFIRTAVIAAAFLIALVVLISNLVKEQLIHNDDYRKLAFDQYTTELSINPKRGTIYDRNMKALAVSATVENVYLSPKMIKPEQEELIADDLEEKLDADKENLISRARNKKNQYYVVKRQVERDVTDEIRAWMTQNDVSEGIYFEENTKRYYPYGHLASHVLGFTDSANKGIYGVEAKYDHYLKGIPGKVITAHNGVGKDMPFEYESFVGAEDGTNVVLTIDWTIQSFLEKALESALIDTKAQNRVLGIVTDVKSGEILAMSVKPDYDPNSPYTLDDASQAILDAFTGTEEEQKDERRKLLEALWKNKAVTELYEPGSTFKLVTSAIALEEGKVSENDTFYCSGSMRIAGWSKPIHCHKVSGHGTETFEQGLQNSCNPVFMQLAARIGKNTFYKYFEEFGCMDITGIDLPSEASGIYHYNLSDFNDVELASYSFGQTFTITPVQLLNAVSAVANGGYLMRPHVVKAFTDGDGNIVKTVEPEVIRQVVSEQTSSTIMRYLANGIDVGSTKNAYVKGYAVAAKTGTAEKHGAEKDKAGNITPYVGSCVAFAPADDPQVAILVAIDTPTSGQYYGGVIAAPVVSQVLSDTLPYLNIAPVLTEEEKESMAVSVGDYRTLNAAEAQEKVKKDGFQCKVMGTGDVVNEQFPRFGTAISGSGIVILYTGGETPSDNVTVPNCIGKTAADANRAVINSSLNIYMDGTYREGVNGAAAVAVSQTPAAGEKVMPGTVVTVTFKHLDGTD